MSEHDKLLATLGPGDIGNLPPTTTVEFIGRSWCVKTALLDATGGALLITSAPTVEQVNAAGIVNELMRLAANVLIIASDWRKAEPDEVADIGARMFAYHFDVIHQQHLAHLAKRGKPS